MRAAILLLVAASCGGGGGTPRSEVPASSMERERGLAAFETVRTVLQHPRCQNCHPAGDAPLQGDDSHVHTQNVQRGPEGKGMPGLRCTTCHGPANPPAEYGEHIPPGNVKGWRMPKADMKLVFVGLSAHALCEQIKDPARNGAKNLPALREHLDDPLVTWGWSPGFGRAPVPVPRARLLEAWETWAHAGTPCP